MSFWGNTVEFGYIGETIEIPSGIGGCVVMVSAVMTEMTLLLGVYECGVVSKAGGRYGRDWYWWLNKVCVTGGAKEEKIFDWLVKYIEGFGGWSAWGWGTVRRDEVQVQEGGVRIDMYPLVGRNGSVSNWFPEGESALVYQLGHRGGISVEKELWEIHMRERAKTDEMQGYSYWDVYKREVIPLGCTVEDVKRLPVIWGGLHVSTLGMGAKGGSLIPRGLYMEDLDCTHNWFDLENPLVESELLWHPVRYSLDMDAYCREWQKECIGLRIKNK